jgi:signal transduction histidine kinase
VREHHGAIDCESVVGQGTRFVLEFPPVPVERPARAAHS